MGERIFEFIKAMNLSVAEFERRCGLSNGAVSKMSENTRASTFDRISKIFPALDIIWLKTGEGEMLKPDSGIHNNKVSGNSGTMTMNNGQHINITLPEEGTQKIIKPDGTVEIVSNHDKYNEYLELLKKKDEQIDKLISIIEKNSK